MIHWLTESSSHHKDLSAGRVPPGLLTATEQVFFDGLKSDKRRHDWLVGRWTGKRLVQAVLGNGVMLTEIEILAAEDGAPVVSVQYSVSSEQLSVSSEQGTIPNTQYPISNLTISISHSADRAFCAVVEGAGVPLGVDIERIETRTEAFVQDYFVREEIALVEATPSSNRGETPSPNRVGMVTAIWSAKEAALKAIRVGLMADTFAVRCLPQGDGMGWSPILIEWDVSKLKRAAPGLRGWWRVLDGFVLTIALGQSSRAPFEEVQSVQLTPDKM